MSFGKSQPGAHQQVGKHFWGGTDTNVGYRFVRQLADKEDQAAKPLGQPAVFGAVVEVADRLIRIARKGG